MSEFKGTKGNWEVAKDEFWENTIIKHNAFTICKVNVAPDNIEQANALLISKAPEMLELLNELINLKGCVNLQLQDKARLLIKQATQPT